MSGTPTSNTLSRYDFLEAFGHLARLFPKDAPDVDDKPIIEDYYRSVQFYDSDELWRAVEILRDNHTYTTFPRPAELKVACKEAQSKRPMKHVALPAPQDEPTPKGLISWGSVCSSYCHQCVVDGKEMMRDGLIDWAVSKGYNRDDAERRCRIEGG